MFADDHLLSKNKNDTTFNIQQFWSLPLYFMFFGASLGMNDTTE
jgi:hypothetical protein